MQPSAISVLRHWPDMCRDLEEEQVDAAVSYERHTGEHIFGPTVPSFNDPEHLEDRKGPFVAPAQIRRKFFRMLLRQVARLGFKVDYGKPVRDYFEDVLAGKGGVMLESGEVLVADIVVAADGLKSRSEILIAGEHIPTKSSGMSIYRTAYPRELAMRDETVRSRWGDSPPVWEYWLGPGMYIGVFLSPETVSWGFTPRDAQGAATESWEPDADPEDVVRALLRAPDWDPAIVALVRTAPRGAVVHWPLLWRDLRREWTSPNGHVVQVGDSAHSFIPTSGNGATQALEDAITLATCLQLGGGPRGAPMAAKIYNLLRYERVSCAQKMSFVNSQLKTATDWDAIREDPAKIRTRFPKWIFTHDPEEYAYEKYGQAFAHLVAGAEFANTNFPPGHKFVPWTIEEVYRDIEAGKKVEDLLDGDWW
jgi:2-polyprenyl-6-methoxyphenol hydroxylase-like FAD-dependent oxidoreductase